MNISKQLRYTTLNSKKEISNVFKNGKKIKSEVGPVYLLNEKENKDSKFAILIKSDIGKAYYRNYIKRIIRFYIRTNTTLFENFNRVIFLYNYKKKKIDYSFLKANYDTSFNK